MRMSIGFIRSGASNSSGPSNPLAGSVRSASIGATCVMRRRDRRRTASSQMWCEDVSLNSYDVLVQRDAVTCAFTVDVEDWYQSCIDLDAPITDRVIRNSHKVLKLLNEKRVRGTFFIQGKVAEAFPDLVRDIYAEGHEIQSHGYSHRPLNSMKEPEFRTEMELARRTVEDACGVQVTAFRAPDFAICERNLWMLEVLCEMGFRVDSSIFPAGHAGTASVGGDDGRIASVSMAERVSWKCRLQLEQGGMQHACGGRRVFPLVAGQGDRVDVLACVA